MLEVSDIVCGYGAVEILHGLSLAVRARSLVAVIGGNGAGKSTVMQTVCGCSGPAAAASSSTGAT